MPIIASLVAAASKAGAAVTKATASTSKVATAIGKGAGYTKKGISSLFDHTIMFFILFGYLVYAAITGSSEILGTCLAPAAVAGGMLAVLLGGIWGIIVMGACLLYKILLEPFTKIYTMFIFPETLTTRGIVANRAVVDRMEQLEPLISLIALFMYLSLIRAVVSNNKRWIRFSGGVLLAMILIGLMTNAGVYVYDIAFRIWDTLIQLLISNA